MIKIDKTDSLYKYLTALKIDNVDKLYTELANNGRYKRQDVRTYIIEKFAPSLTTELEETELEPILDFYLDIKNQKKLTKQKQNTLLKNYYQTKNKQVRDIIYNSCLKDVLHMCLNYKSLHKDVDLQDLVQTANIGLIDAIENYNPTAKIDLNDYIIFHIREKIIKEFEENAND